ncbi:STAS domain-containing protein [Actinopolymorpha alba]|uniref:STAS domain-containing protein n=1 Tax=Actinopolymorpha alba TaxID=533267 RepID=UPI00035C89EB|nr:STAS domain-containing protein [Actinopolymorpha alba]
MLLDDVYSLARRVAPRRGASPEAPPHGAPPHGAPPHATAPRGVGSRLVRRARDRLLPAVPAPERRPASISRDLICLQPTGRLDAGTAATLVSTVIGCVTACDPLPVAVVLALEATPEIDDAGCEALLELHHKLRASGPRLYVGAVERAVLDRLNRSGALNHLGADVVRPSLRTALLAAYEQLSGPAVVTRGVVAALENRLIPLPLT